MSPDALLAIAVTAAVLGALLATRLAPDVVFLAGLAILMATDVLTPGEALAGFANPAVITIGVLYALVAGLRETGVVHWLGRHLMGRPGPLRIGLLRLTGPVAAVSALLNNTPVVAMLIPAVREWARNAELPASKVMIPLSFAAILGGTCTLIGTSTNLVVDGLLIAHTGVGLGLFELAWVGVPVTLAGLAFLVLLGPRLLPDRRGAIQRLDDPREYSVEMTVAPNGPLVGRTVAGAGLRQLSGLYLVEIDRDGEVHPAVGPGWRLEANDRLVFVGVVDSVVELQRIRGLLPAEDQVFKLDGARGDRVLVEAVVSDASPVVGRTIRASRFRNRYGAVVVAVARGAARLREKLGDIVLLPGDTLLLETRPSFADRHRQTRDFYLVSRIGDSNPLRFERAATAVIILAAMVTTVATGLLSLLEAALLAVAAMLATRCLRAETARNAVDWSVLIVIGAAFGLGVALEKTGVAAGLAGGLTTLAGGSPFANLVGVYLATAVVSAVITNNAAAALMFPVALGVAEGLGASVLPFAVAVAISASASFLTPLGYQTNLMVYAPGGYRFADFLRIGLPLTVLTATVALAVIPRVWGFG